MKEDSAEDPLPFHGEIPFRIIGKCTCCTDLCAKGVTVTEIAGHGPFGNGMKRWGAVRTGIETRFAADASFLIRHDCVGPGGAPPRTGGADIHAGGLFAVLTDGGHEDRNLFPLLHPYPGKGRTAGALMGEAADHFAGLASCAAFRDDGDGAHLDDLRYCSS